MENKNPDAFYYVRKQYKWRRLYKAIGGKDMFIGLKDVINKTFQTVNWTNSSLNVQCVVPEKCGLRHTTSCDDCKNNIGAYKDKIFYEPR